MKTLMIKDLSVTEQLDSQAMRAVRGGFGPSLYYNFSPIVAPNNSKNLTATQLISNELNQQNANGNNVAFAAGITSTNDPFVTSNNNIHM
ncbi:hypothetical protein GXB81_13255 [Paraburkholderia sp. Ac-20336]|uniref:hypothetical protein n=1 Tax=Burkholderiaceae TaxID=119060 RepID=UPI001422B33B|nr:MULTISPECIES: hypothetical protein [Burkholderiaceae]MBN3804013.1 hypothetical protein [Paraburkholderia sp. Ac-20336]MBN3847626.1 hypothetical protein [Paraburkholderia sp. Ac-20342]NIF53369.1 hypothetical protein [Burkholderia sp. Ax-1724]NIF78710.1 hypothetical protein [Paraburkholderia sp. Cy-641]